MGHGIALAASAARPICSSDFGRANGTPSGIGRGWGLASSNGSSAAVPVPERPIRAASDMARKADPDQAARLRRAGLDIGTTLRSYGSPRLSQTSCSAVARSSISRSLWKGVGVIRSRSAPRGTVG